ncbi:hypothetical protein [Deefgea salmonis]|uniref:Phosphate ABC transporter substrate-binding protein n=1 Tax=Deefgea salmonis TaxID=2875502 RepID=A0ABS8BPR5_9NEIS|nr:hypothetical protein [Deefgea salmonis]MCB5197551.1 hypothetical protein [Deefgea salmonis]
MKKNLLLLFLTLNFSFAHAELWVIAHPQNAAVSLTPQQVSDIYLGRLFGGNVPLQPLEINSDELRRRFYFALTGKPLVKIDAYWARLQFAGQQKPPRRLADPASVIKSISLNQDQIGFIEANTLPSHSGVKVVLKLE